jgi:uncharacterized protein (DUF1800 family)
MAMSPGAVAGPRAEELADRDTVRRLLQRLGLGPRPGELDRAVTAGFAATLEGLVHPVGADAGLVSTPVPVFGSEPSASGAKPGSPQRRAVNQQVAARATELQAWWVDRMAAVDAPLPERLAWLWHGHFATAIGKVRSAPMMLAQNETFRRLGAGDFRELARALIADPAMLVWLDGAQNRKGRPNENLAREFMELFTLGVGNYTEADVRQAARALTGWRVDRVTGTASWVAAQHDPGPQTVLGTTASLDATGFADLVVARPESAEFIATRMWTRFVSANPPDHSTLAELTAAYGPRRDITALLRAIATNPGFRDPAAVLVRQPVEWVVATLRALRLRPSALPTPAQRALHAGLTQLGQVPFDPPNVGGWPSGTAWLTTAAAAARLTLAQALTPHADLSTVTSTPRPARVDATAALLGLPTLSDRTRAALDELTADPPRLVELALTSPENVVSG